MSFNPERDLSITEETPHTGATCRACGEWSRRTVTVTLHFPTGGAHEMRFCGRSCAAREYGALVERLPQSVRAAAERLRDQNRRAIETMLPPREDLFADSQRRDWTALCNESQRLNRRR